MQLQTNTVRQGINKAYLKIHVKRGDLDGFKIQAISYLNQVDEAENESEEHLKGYLKDFLTNSFYDDEEKLVNTSDRIDLAIYSGKTTSSSVDVIIETKRPDNKAEMISKDNSNRKALQEALHYYFDQRESGNDNLKQVVITNYTEFFIFDAQEIERHFYSKKKLVKNYRQWKNDEKVSGKTDFIYQKFEEYILNSDTSITTTYVDLKKFRKQLSSPADEENDKKLIPLFKLFSPEHLVKKNFANDSNSLDKRFYNELLHILGLQEVKEKGSRLIQRLPEKERQRGSLIENTIEILRYDQHMNEVREATVHYGQDEADQLFGVALELVITWMNRVLFLKLMEAQLLAYHNQDEKFRFLGFDTIDEYDELNKLFFRVLALRNEERPPSVQERFGHIPYLNSSLFDSTKLEKTTIQISGLDDKATLDLHSRSILKKGANPPKEKISTLDYLLRFLDAYNFSAESSGGIQTEDKTLINASVLGLIFEKINGYKDGSFFTPGFITEYMARETLRKAITDKFWNHLHPEENVSSPAGERETDSSRSVGIRGRVSEESLPYNASHPHPDSEQAQNRPSPASGRRKQVGFEFEDLPNLIGHEISYKQANELINSMTICDPAVGSGHFLVSCLNELIAIKSELKILCDREGKRIPYLDIEVENDELAIEHNGELFEYKLNHEWKNGKVERKPAGKERQCIQEALFHEKKFLIENCLFGVDINPNSVKICRLRLWIELLKHAYYKSHPASHSEDTSEESTKADNSFEPYSELEVLPNIDINIKQGNSLVSRFGLDEDLSSIFKKSEHSLDDYKQAVKNYRETRDRSEKQRLQTLIDDIKAEYSENLLNNKPINKKLSKARGRLDLMQNEDLFGEGKASKKELKKQEKKVTKLEEQKAEEEAGAFFREAFEWRFEFPEVLDDAGNYIGFDVVIGNPPYIYRKATDENFKPYYKKNYSSAFGNYDLYKFFTEKAIQIVGTGGRISLIIPNTFLSATTYERLREFIIQNVSVEELYDLGLNIFEDVVVENIVLRFIKGLKNKRLTTIKIQRDRKRSFNEDVKSYQIDLVEIFNKESTFNIYLDDETYSLIKKIRGGTKKLEEIAYCTVGINTGYIKDELTASEKLDDTYHKMLNGKDIGRNTVEWQGEWIKFDPEFVKSFGKKGRTLPPQRIFEENKILVQRTRRGMDKMIVAYYDNEKFYNLNRISNIVLDEKDNFNLKYLYALVNSNLIEYYFKNVFNEYEVKPTHLSELPIKVIEKEKQKAFIDLIDQILTTKKENPEADTSALEAEIDQLVYELYGLTEEEIEIVEGSVG